MADSNDGRRPSKLDSHVQSQFPGEFPAAYTRPYRPPGLAAEYYGDHGESVADQPGVRPQPPSIIHTADQAHLHEPTAEAAPPPEPSSLGQVGAAASFFASPSDHENPSFQTAFWFERCALRHCCSWTCSWSWRASSWSPETGQRLTCRTWAAASVEPARPFNEHGASAQSARAARQTRQLFQRS